MINRFYTVFCNSFNYEMGPWFDRSRFDRVYLIIIIFLSVLVFGLFLAVCVLSRKPEDTSICETRECLIAAVNLQESLNSSADPCDDFYSYACGGFINTHPIPEHESVWGQEELSSKIVDESVKELLEAEFDPKKYPAVVEKSKIFYNSCMNIPLRNGNAYNGLKNLFKQISWPMLDVSWESYNYKWEKTFAYINKVFGFNFLLSNYVSQDMKNTSSHIIYVGPPSFGVDREVLRHPKTEYSLKIIAAYKKFIGDSVKLLSNSDRDVNRFLSNKINDLVEFEIRLANITTDFGGNLYKAYETKTTINEFMLAFKGIPLLTIEKSVFEHITDDGITESEEVIVIDKNYLKNFRTVIDETDNEVIASYLGWRLVQELSKYTTMEFRKIEFEYNQIEKGVQQEKPLWDECVEHTNRRLPLVVGRLFVDKKFSADAKSNCRHMSQQIILSFKQLLDSNKWMSPSTKQNALDKINSMHIDIGYPDLIKNNKLLENYHKELDIINENYFESAVNLLKWSNTVTLKRLRTTITDRKNHAWVNQIAVVNAFYSPLINRITIPAGILQYPFYSNGLPMALNLGGIGAIIGHEIMHAFDENGAQFDKHGNRIDWWDTNTKLTVKEKAQCFINQYNNYYDPSANLWVNGNKTLGENVADSEGLRLAYQALKNYKGNNHSLPGSMKIFTAPQLFFLSFAKSWCSSRRTKDLILYMQTNYHSPIKYRVLGSVSNSAQFANAFNCRSRSKRSNRKMCHLL